MRRKAVFPAASLDLPSRLTLRWTAIRVCALVLIWSFPWLTGRITFGNVLAFLSPVFTFTALFAMIVACIRQERIGAPSLNTWDEAVAFSGLAALVHAAHRLAY